MNFTGKTTDGRETLANAVLAAAFLIALAVMLRMAFVSKLDAHPDERHHVDAAAYYMANWDPPRLDDPRLAASLSKYGVSYLQQLDVVYFAAGTFARLTSLILPEPHMALRLFNIGLFAVLALLSFRLRGLGKLAFLPLLCSPQIWYVFSYFNADAFPLFLSFLLVYLFARSGFPTAPKAVSLGDPVFRRLAGMGLALGLLCASKQNYYVLVAFFPTFLLLVAFQEKALGRGVKNLILILALAGAVFGLRYAAYAYVNRDVPAQAAADIAERYAQQDFKPSAETAGNLFWGMRMRDQGLSLAEMFTKWNWHVWSFRTSFGVYDYMKIYAPLIYYRYVKWALLALFLFTAIPLAQSGRKGLAALGLFLLFAGLTAGQSLYHSWTSDFQAQGRYLFPIVGMAGLVLARFGPALRRFLPGVLLSGLALYGLSLYSFVWVGLGGVAR